MGEPVRDCGQPIIDSCCRRISFLCLCRECIITQISSSEAAGRTTDRRCRRAYARGMKTFTASDGARLAFYEEGSGAVVLFLHPTPLDHQYWLPLIALLGEKTAERSRGVRAIAPDLRGHGDAELGTLATGGFREVADAPVLSVERLARDAVELLDELQVKRAAVVGCSIGGYVALELWRQAPERVSGLALVCSKPQPDTEAARARRVGSIARARAEGTADIFDAAVSSLVAGRTREQRPELVAALRQSMRLTTEAYVAVQAGLAMRPDARQLVASITVPVLGLVGEEDTGVTADEMAVMLTSPGGAELHRMGGVGHFAAAEDSRAVAGFLLPWLEATAKMR